MNKQAYFRVLPVALFVAAGVAAATPVEVSPAKCLTNGSCLQTPNKVCVDNQGDGICDYTRSAWQPV